MEGGWRLKLSSLPADRRQPKSVLHLLRWRTSVFDHGECALNPSTQRAAAAHTLNSVSRWILLHCEEGEAEEEEVARLARVQQATGLLRLMGVQARR